MACDIWHRRVEYKEIHRNPLKHRNLGKEFGAGAASME